MSDLHPLTVASIEGDTINSRRYGCGCFHDLALYVCPYHQGYEDGIEAHIASQNGGAA